MIEKEEMNMNDFSLNIGSTILRLRKEMCLTQEQLAEILGVTAGAVSKWENGNSTPDIALLAPLARSLNTSLDMLLNFQRNITDDEVINIKQEINEIFLHKSYYEGEKRCNEYLKEYPNSVYLKYIIANSITMYITILDTKDENVINDKLKYSLKLLQQVVDSRESKYVNAALFAIANIQMMLENYEESEKAIIEISNSFLDPMVLYTSLLQRQGKDKETIQICERMLLQYINQATAMLSILSNISKKEEDFEKTKLFINTIVEIQNIFNVGMYSGAYNYYKLYLVLNDYSLASKWFKIYVEGIISTYYDYSNNPYFKNLKLEIDVEGQKAIRKKMLQSIVDEKEHKVLNGILDYEEAIGILNKEINFL